MGKIVFLVNVLLFFTIEIVHAQFWRKFDNSYFRKSGMAFKNEAIVCDKRIKFNGVYKLSDVKFGYLYLIFYPNGLMCTSSSSYKSKQLVYPNCLFKTWNDTILCFTRDYNSTMSGKAFHINLFKIIDENNIQEITTSMTVDESKSLDENISELSQPNQSVYADSIIYTFEEMNATPSYGKSPWLKKKYFWASDSLYNNYFKKQ